jgi:hypothetical protein
MEIALSIERNQVRWPRVLELPLVRARVASQAAGC